MEQNSAIDAEVEARVLEIFERNVPGAANMGVTLDTRIQDELGLPSITVVTILFDLQDTLGIELLESEVSLADLQTVRDIAAIVPRVGK